MSVLVNANEHEISKAFIPAKTRKKEASKGDALPDGSFPIRNRTDLVHAKEDLGRTSPGKRAAARRLIARRSKQLEKSATMAKCRHGMKRGDCKICERTVTKALDQRTAPQRGGRPHFKALNNSRAGEVIKAYTAGTITYHQAAAREEGRKKRSSESVARAGAATAVGAAYSHAHAGDVASKLKLKPSAVKTGSKAAAVAGVAAAGAGVAGAVVHGVKRNQHFKAAQAGRLEREPAISKAFGVEISKDLSPEARAQRKRSGVALGAIGGGAVGQSGGKFVHAVTGGPTKSLRAYGRGGLAAGAIAGAAAGGSYVKHKDEVAKASLGALDDIALAPQKIASAKNTVTGNNPATVPPQKKKILAPITAAAGDTTPTATAPLPGQSTLTKSAFGPSL